MWVEQGMRGERITRENKKRNRWAKTDRGPRRIKMCHQILTVREERPALRGTLCHLKYIKDLDYL